MLVFINLTKFSTSIFELNLIKKSFNYSHWVDHLDGGRYMIAIPQCEIISNNSMEVGDMYCNKCQIVCATDIQFYQYLQFD